MMGLSRLRRLIERILTKAARLPYISLGKMQLHSRHRTLKRPATHNKTFRYPMQSVAIILEALHLGGPPHGRGLAEICGLPVRSLGVKSVICNHVFFFQLWRLYSSAFPGSRREKNVEPKASDIDHNLRTSMYSITDIVQKLAYVFHNHYKVQLRAIRQYRFLITSAANSKINQDAASRRGIGIEIRTVCI